MDDIEDLAEEFAERNQHRLRYDEERKAWLAWVDHHWKKYESFIAAVRVVDPGSLRREDITGIYLH